MASCHDGTAEPDRAGSVATRPTRIALVGNPNVGKSTLFNALTGSRQRTVNAPGTTVQLSTGIWSAWSPAVELIDLPGTYSLLARSPDEQVTVDLLTGRSGTEPTSTGSPPDLVLLVADASAVGRSLYLLAQVAQTGSPVVMVLSMADVAAHRGVRIDVPALRAALGVPVVVVNPRTGSGLSQLVTTVEEALAAPTSATDPAGVTPGGVTPEDETERAELRFVWVESVLAATVRSAPYRLSRSDRIDRVVLNPWLGVPLFLACMWGVFTLTTRVAAPLQAHFEALVTGPLSSAARAALSWVGAAGTPVEGLLVDGLLAGVGTVLTFVPLMGIMFLVLGVLEDSGYLARAALVGDRAMRMVGLDGRAVLPLIVGFGCNVPALSATRTLPNARQRMLAGLLVPLTSCSARLTVYVLLASVFFQQRAGTVVFAMYLTSGALVVLAGLLMRRTAFRDVQREPLVLELPPYRVPAPRALFAAAWFRVRGFVRDVGTIIVGTLTVMWLLTAIPASSGHSFGRVPLAESVFGEAARTASGVFAPAGFGDWPAVAALASGFVAKEVVVGSLGQSYAAAGTPGRPESASLASRLRESFDVSSGGHGPAAALAFLVFVLAYTPCLATLAEQRRLFGWRPTVAAMGLQLALAWLLAVAAFQIGRLL
ncbi:MAG: ferrous iron transport protein B [Actinobacteria bacterium]|nr:ferrous iron transport protein B [Actinomycetota bacterium]MBI3687356.1 ferrous iron transport protein B [Actinomycetota bacterium]